MGSSLYVLCYHRVLEQDGHRENQPYFLRGTAVSRAAFTQHVEDVREHFDCLDEERALAVLRGDETLRRPGCWITFDDAYSDSLYTAAPVLELLLDQPAITVP